MKQAEMRLKENVFGLFGPDALLPVQYFDLLRRKVPIEPEIRLMWAVLEDAIECYRRHMGSAKGKPGEELDEVENWIFDPDGDWLFSFENICSTLGIDADYLRGGLLTLKQRSSAVQPAEFADAVPAAEKEESAAPEAGGSGYERLTATG